VTDDRRASGRDIPEAVKREVRRSSGFGCCICGNPIIEYHHIRGREGPDPHNPDDMMAMCPLHHDMCTKRALSVDEQIAAKEQPLNIERGYVDGRLKVDQEFCALALGPNTFFDKSIPFSIDGVPLLAISVVEGRLSVDLSLYGDQDELLVEVGANDWIAGDPAVWDLWSSYQQLKVRTKLGQIRLGIDARVVPMELRAILVKDGKEIRIRPSGITTSGDTASLQMNGAAICGVDINLDTAAGTVRVNGHPGVMTVEADPQKRLEWGIAEMAALAEAGELEDGKS
jgi:hypothetical protein